MADQDSFRLVAGSAVPGQQPEPIVTHYQGSRLNSPNDLTVDRDGAIWFTDPTFGILMPDQGSLANPELDHRSVYRFDPGDGPLAGMADFEQLNGVFFSPDGRVLYVSDTALSLGEIPNAGSGKTHEIVAVHQRGWVWTSAADGVHVWSAERQRLGFIPVSQTVSNCCFGGRDGRRLLMAATTLLLATDLIG